jgi:hypothetical protein
MRASAIVRWPQDACIRVSVNAFGCLPLKASPTVRPPERHLPGARATVFPGTFLGGVVDVARVKHSSRLGLMNRRGDRPSVRRTLFLITLT